MSFRFYLLLLATTVAFSAEQDYLISHAPENQQWSSDLYFRTQLPDTLITIDGYVVSNGTGNGPGTLTWTSDPLNKSVANSLITPAELKTLINGRAYDFLIIHANQPLGEGKANFTEPNVAHSTRVLAMDAYKASANFNNITIDEEAFAGLAFVVANPSGEEVTLRYRFSSAAGEILKEATTTFSDHYTKVLGLVNGLIEDFEVPANARLNVAVDGDAKIVNGILLQGKGLTMYGGEAESVDGDITFHKDVSRILQKNCQQCHHSGGTAPFSLIEYDEVKPLRHVIEHEVEEGKMPPWKPTPDCGSFKYDNSLSPHDKDVLMAWIRDGSPQGDTALAPEKREFADAGWQIGTPDLVYEYTEPVLYEPGPDAYVCLPVPLNNSEPIFLEALELQPGNLNVVHHIVLYSTTTNEATQRDDAETGPGYTCFGDSGIDEQTLVGAWAPGSPQFPYPVDLGFVVEPNTTLIIQLHYSSELGISEPEEDLTRIGLYTTEVAPPEELQFVFLGNDEFVIPAGNSAYVVDDEIILPIPVDIYMVFPHMHLLGREISLGFTPPGGTYQCIINIEDWDFAWQGFYNLMEPVTIPAFSRIKIHAVFDNSEDNPLNPNSPPQDTRFGDTTKDEMLIHAIGFTAPIKVDKRAIQKHRAKH